MSNQLAEQARKIRDKLSDRRYWVKNSLFELDFDGNKPVIKQACLLGAHLDTLTDRAAWTSTPDVKWDPAGDYEYAQDVVNEDPLNRLVMDVIIEQFPERVLPWNDNGDPASMERQRALMRLPWNGIPSFNDHDDTTHADLMLVLDKVVVRAEELV